MGMDIIYRASEIGGCTKALVCKRLGYEPMDAPADFQEKYFEAGKNAEQEVYDLLASGGEIVTDFQREVNIHLGEGVYIQGHIDGVLDGRVLEIKSMSTLEFARFKKSRWDTVGLVQKYKWQISVYMVALDAEATVLIYNRDTGEIHREGVEVPWYGVGELFGRVADVENWVAKGQTPTTCDFSNYPCPFYYLHEDSEVEEDGELEEVSRQYETLRQQEKQIKSSMESVRKRILDGMGDRTKLRAGIFTLSRSSVTNKRFDQDKARADGVDVDKYMVESKSTRLNVKVEADSGE